MKRLLLGLLLVCGVAAAQQGGVFSPRATTTLSATTVSSNVTVSSSSNNVMISNAGSVTVFIKFGSDSSVTATTGDLPVLGGTVQVFSKGGTSYIAGITGTGSATVYVTGGDGQ